MTLETSIVGYRRQYATVSSGQLLAPVISRLHTVSQLLERAHPDGMRAQLYSIAGQAAGLAGWLSFDLHDHATAGKYYGVALDAARRFADPWLEAYLLGAQSFLALYHGDVPRAREALDAAYNLAKRGSSRTTLAWIAAVQAEAHSLVGRERACLLALDERDEPWRRLGPTTQQPTSSTPPDWPATMEPAWFGLPRPRSRSRSYERRLAPSDPI